MAKRTFSSFVEQEVGKFPHFLLYAVLEWILIILLFIDGFLAFIANEFARFFGLQTPCLFCTRIDHVLVHRSRDFYFNDSVCEAHKKEVSSLTFCHNHKKIADIRRMCEVCLLSFAADKADSECDTYKSLVGILQKDLEENDDHDDNHDAIRHRIQLGLGFEEIKAGGLRCSCCGEAAKAKKAAAKAKTGALNNNNIGKGRQYYGGSLLFSQAPAPSPRAMFSRLRSSGELKLMPENEAELLPEFENGSSQAVTSEKLREDVKAAMMPLLTEADDLNDEAYKTPSFVRGNKFFGIPLTDSASNSPRLGMRVSRKSPLEKTEFASESMEGINVHMSTNDTDTDSILHGLKRQVRLDRKSLMALYMELDEERSASAVAANNAMAMITRLQAEKAAVQMEALQYQRMMEEQFEYDQEALQETNELLMRREEDIKALEAELEAYREKYGCLKEEGFTAYQEENGDNDDLEPKTHSYYSSDSGRTEIGSPPLSFDEGEANGEIEHNFDKSVPPPLENEEEEISGESLKDFKEEKAYFLGRKKLDKKDNLCENGIDSETETSSP